MTQFAAKPLSCMGTGTLKLLNTNIVQEVNCFEIKPHNWLRRIYLSMGLIQGVNEYSIYMFFFFLIFIKKWQGCFPTVQIKVL